MKRLAIAVAISAALVLTPSASAAIPVGTYQGKITSGFLKGNWKFQFYSRRAQWDYKVTGPFGWLKGKITYKGSNRVIFHSESEGTICPGRGEYRYRVSRGALKMTAIREPCRPRRLVHTVPTYRKT